ncbi:IS5 family transposase [Streptomyces virginiae]|uniref:IS5 family transposase n=1 Tax=Streptomyces virginiae TaxID=1961 RepID=UPI00099CCDBE|nr:IS5 family transposase [Streptomyces virginiae]
MTGRGDLTEAEWRRLEPLLPTGNNRCGRWRDHRQVINGILHRVRTGAQWRDLPERYAHGRHGTPERKTVGETVRPPGGGGAGGEALGRSRGGFTTKIRLSADGRCRVLSLLLTAGQRADCTQFGPVMERIRVPRLRPGRPRTTPDSVSADRAYSNRRTRRYLRRRGIRHVIPEKSDQAVNRVRRGRAGGRPPGFDKERYKKRNTVERAINKLKNYRAVSTRYDKRAYVYLGTITVAATIIWLRT